MITKLWAKRNRLVNFTIDPKKESNRIIYN